MDKKSLQTKEFEWPFISVLMTAYNREKYIGEAIESVLASTYKNLELIVVDDCSSDNTPRIVEEYCKKDARIRFYRNKKNLGDYPNRNQAAKLASGKYIKYLDSDDIIYPHGLDVMVSCMEKYPEAGFGLSEIAFYGKPQPVCLDSYQSYKENFLQSDLFGRAPGSSIIKTDAFRDVGGFTGKRQVGDHEFWLIISRKYPLVTMPRDLVWDSTHDEQEKMRDDQAEKAGMHFAVDIEALHHADCPLSAAEKEKAIIIIRAQHRKSFWRILLRSGGVKNALRYKSKVKLD